MKINQKIVLLFMKIREGILAAILIAISSIITWMIVTKLSNSDFILFGIAALSALFAAFSAYATLLQATEARLQRENVERPYVLANFEPGSNHGVYFVIKNYGASPASNVRISFDPIPIDHVGRSFDQISVFANPITFLPPGKEYRQFIDVGPKFLADDRPKIYHINFTYQSLNGILYNEDFDEDVSFLVEATLPPKTAADHLSTIALNIKEINNTLKSISTMDSILVESPDEFEKRINGTIDDD